jgi:hypothetical protein
MSIRRIFVTSAALAFSTGTALSGAAAANAAHLATPSKGSEHAASLSHPPLAGIRDHATKQAGQSSRVSPLHVRTATSPAPVYDATSSPLPGNLPSYGGEAYAFNELGDRVQLGSGARSLTTAVVTLSSWACESGSWTTNNCTTTPGDTFSEPITFNIYNSGPGGTLGSLIASKTQTFAIPYRPTSTPAQCGGDASRWYDSTTAACYHGLATNVTFDFSSMNVHLPNQVIYGIAYNTSHFGYSPYGQGPTCFSTAAGCGYDSLNVAVDSDAAGNPLGPSVGTDVDPNVDYGADPNGAWDGVYCSGQTPPGNPAFDKICWPQADDGTNTTPAVQLNTAPGTLTVCSSGGQYSTIQAAINAAGPGDTINVCAGTYAENLDVTQSVTINGAGQGQTIIEPATSNPGTGCGDGSAIDCREDVMRVGANNVTIQNLTVNGDNPSLHSGVEINGADVDAGNGIVADYDVSGPVLAMNVNHVTVENVYMRGIYQGTTQGTFNFNHDTVTNDEGDPYGSIAMFEYEASGSMDNNTVSEATDAIHANWTYTGVSFDNNTVSNSGSGVEVDNVGEEAGAVDQMENNTITCGSGGWGATVFAPYRSVTVSGNTLTGCAAGLASFSSNSDSRPYTAPLISFSNNTVDGQNGTDSIGALISTDKIGYCFDDTNDSLVGNTIVNTTNSVATWVGDLFGYGDTPGGTSVFGQSCDTRTPVITMSAHFNRFNNNRAPSSDSGDSGWINIGATTVDATDNWWGCNAGAGTQGDPACDAVASGITVTPWLTLTLSPSSTTLPASGSQVLTASMNQDNNGADTSGSGMLPNGTPISFSLGGGDVGSLTSCATSLVGGVASCTFDAPTTQPSKIIPTSHISATVDSASVQSTVQTQHGPVLTWDPISPVALPASLNSSELNAKADVGGTFVYSPVSGTALSPGLTPLSATFMPTDTNRYVSGEMITNTVMADDMGLNLTCSGDCAGGDYYYGDTVHMSATITACASGCPTIGGTVQFYRGNPKNGTGVTLGSPVLVAGGVATKNFSFTPGGKVITAVYSGDGTYAGDSKHTSIDVLRAPLTITASSETITYGDPQPTVTALYSGFVLGESSSDLNQGPHCLDSESPNAPANVYPMGDVCKGARSGDYTISYVPGTLTVNQSDSTVTLDSLDPATIVSGHNLKVSMQLTSNNTAGGISGRQITVTLTEGSLHDTCSVKQTSGPTKNQPVYGFGSCTIKPVDLPPTSGAVLTVSFAGDVDYTPSSVTQSVSIS